MADALDVIFGVLDYDPCEALAVIRPAYMRMLAGATEQKINFRDRETWFHRGDIEKLASLVSQLEAECAKKQGVTIKTRRRAIVVGGRYQ